MTPKVTAIRRDDTHRLIPSRYGDESGLARLGDSDRDLEELFELEGATTRGVLEAKPTFQAKSARGAVDHVKIVGGMGFIARNRRRCHQ